MAHQRPPCYSAIISVTRSCTSSATSRRGIVASTTNHRSGSCWANARNPSRTCRWKATSAASAWASAASNRSLSRGLRRIRATSTGKSRQHRQVRLQPSGGRIIQAPQLIHIQPASVALVGQGGVAEPVGDHDVAVRQCGRDDLLNVSCALAATNNSASARGPMGMRPNFTSRRIRAPRAVLPGSATVTTRRPASRRKAESTRTCVDLPAASPPSKVMKSGWGT